MALTKRRKDFLAAVLEMYEQRPRPVHYSDVAQVLKVSRWTAYDILRELELDGYLEAVYGPGREKRGPGRNQVFYRPTLKREEFKTGTEDWLVLRARLLALLGEKKRAAREKVAELLHELPEIQGRLAKSAYNLTVLIAHLGEIGGRGRRALAEMISRARHPEQGLSLFAGAAIGSLLRVRGVISGPVEECVKRLQAHLNELEPGEASSLASFLKEGLERSV
ncbi:MAG: hypothetical protein AB1330_07435 [Bacillota bacterium]